MATTATRAGFYINLIDQTLSLKLAVEVRGDDIFFDFAGNPPQVRAGINMIYTALLATVYFAGKSLVDPDIPANAGFHRPIEHVAAPEGLAPNALPPAAFYSRTEIAQRLVDMIFAALAPVIPERVVAASTGGILVTMSGMHPRTGRFYV